MSKETLCKAVSRKSGKIKAQWIRLERPYVFNGFRFLVEIRARNGRISLPANEADVRVRGPLCSQCGTQMARLETRAECERYACRKGQGHGELWVGRTGHLSFSQFMEEHLRPRVYYALLRRRFPIEPASMGAALNLIPY